MGRVGECPPIASPERAMLPGKRPRFQPFHATEYGPDHAVSARTRIDRSLQGHSSAARWKRTGGGKRGGLRVIYYLDPAAEQIYMLFAYLKTAQEDLTNSQLRILRQLVREELK